MSIIPIIIQHEQAGSLTRFRPSFKGEESELRKLSLKSDIHEWLHRSEGSDQHQDMLARARGNCSWFVKGEEVDDCDFIKRVEYRRGGSVSFADGVWALGFRFNPQHRLFGFFAIQNWFVALTIQDRNVLDEHESRWRGEIDKCNELWRELFPEHAPVTGNRLADYLSNVESCDDRW